MEQIVTAAHRNC